MKKYTHTLIHFNYLVQPTGAVSVLKSICPARFITNQFDSVSLYDHFFTENAEERKDFFKFVKKVKQYETELDLSIWMDEETRMAYLQHLQKQREKAAAASQNMFE